MWYVGKINNVFYTLRGAKIKEEPRRIDDDKWLLLIILACYFEKDKEEWKDLLVKEECRRKIWKEIIAGTFERIKKNLREKLSQGTFTPLMWEDLNETLWQLYVTD